MGGAAAGLVVLPRALPERARVGTGPDHRVLGAVRLPARPGRQGADRRWPGRAHGGVLQRCAGLPVGVVPAAPRAMVSAGRGRRELPAGSQWCAGRWKGCRWRGPSRGMTPLGDFGNPARQPLPRGTHKRPGPGGVGAPPGPARGDGQTLLVQARVPQALTAIHRVCGVLCLQGKALLKH
jgi:hypothetical protein